jgi:ubiquitin-conjugating enzyme E2 D/E
LRGSLSVAGTGNPTGVATRTLLNDLKSIQKNPVPYVSAEPVDPSNLFVWHGNLLGPENTPYAGAIFHIELVFPPDYPTNPPSATLFTPLPHPHVHKDHICLDILSDYKGYFSAVQELERKDTKDLSGWHPSYTVQSILLSMQSFLMDMKENAHGTELRELMVKIPDSIRQAANFCCSKCQHRPGQPFPPIAAEVAMSSLSEKEIIAEELRCVHTRAPFTEDVLGICVEVTQRRQTGAIMNLSYQMQLLAHKAFLTGVRTGPSSSAANMVFIPLWIDEEHGARAMPIAEASIAQLYTGNAGAIFHPNMALDVLTQLMKAMVVDLVRYSASINALQYYFASHRLLIAFTRKYPELIGVSNRIVSKFAESPHYRSKRECPDLGCLLMLLTISDLSWRDIAQVYMQESFVRNAPRAMEKAPELATPHPDERVDALRNEKTFLVTRVSLGIAMLQVYFLDHIGKPRGIKLEQVSANYDSLYGRLTVKVREEFLEAIKGISAIKTWAETFKFLGLPPRPSEDVTAWLRECVQLSIKAGYYKPGQSRGGDICKYYQSGRCNRDDCPFYHPSSPNSLQRSNSKNGGSGGGNGSSLGRSGSAKFNNTRDQINMQSPQSHSTSTTPKRPRSRGSSTSSTSASSDVHALDEFDIREFDDSDTGHHHHHHHHRQGEGASLSAPPSSYSLPGTRATSPVPPSSNPGSLSARGAPTPAWTGSNPLINKSTRDQPPRDRDLQQQPIPPAINILPPSTTTVVTQHAAATTVVNNEEVNDDEGWVPAGRPRRKSKSSGSVPTGTQPPTGSPGGRGLGRGQHNPHYQHHPNRHRQEHGHR